MPISRLSVFALSSSLLFTKLALAHDHHSGPSQQAPRAELTAILDVAAAYFSDEPLPGGAHDPDHTGFNFQELELAGRAAADPYFRFDARVVFEPSGIDLEEAYATTLSLPAGLELRFGQFLTRFGRHNTSHPHAWDFADQPFVLTRVFGDEGARGLGAEIAWRLPLDWRAVLSTSATEASGEGTARSFYGALDPGVSSLADLLYTSRFEQLFPLSDGCSLSVGLSAVHGPSSSGEGDSTQVYGADMFLKYRPGSTRSPLLTLHGEWVYRRRELPGDVLADYDGFLQGKWGFAERWAASLRYEYGSPAYGSDRSPALDPLDPEWTQARQRLSAALTFNPSESSRLRLQGNRDLPRWRDAISALFLTAEVMVEADGEHAD